MTHKINLEKLKEIHDEKNDTENEFNSQIENIDEDYESVDESENYH
jgi:hypothetical protein